jgi:hypothetical protein
MNYYMAALTRRGTVIELGWMLAADDNELIQYARTMGYGIDIWYLGQADMSAVMPAVRR